MVTEDPWQNVLLELASAMAEAAPGVLSVVGSKEHILMFKKKPLGEWVLESYAYLGIRLKGWDVALQRFFKNVVKPLQQEAPEAYALACKKLQEMIPQVCSGPRQAELERLVSP